jgi:hypothetical protein
LSRYAQTFGVIIRISRRIRAFPSAPQRPLIVVFEKVTAPGGTAPLNFGVQKRPGAFDALWGSREWSRRRQKPGTNHPHTHLSASGLNFFTTCDCDKDVGGCGSNALGTQPAWANRQTPRPSTLWSRVRARAKRAECRSRKAATVVRPMSRRQRCRKRRTVRQSVTLLGWMKQTAAAQHLKKMTTRGRTWVSRPRCVLDGAVFLSGSAATKTYLQCKIGTKTRGAARRRDMFMLRSSQRNGSPFARKHSPLSFRNIHPARIELATFSVLG